MIPSGKQYKVWILLTIISLLLVGCAPSPKDALDRASSPEQTPEVRPSSEPTVDNHIKDLPVSSPEQSEHEQLIAEDSTTTTKPSVTQEEVVIADESQSKSPVANPKIYNVTEAYDPSSPTLMGFRIDDLQDHVLTRFDKPTSESFMNDGNESLQIFEYPGFIFGFNEANRIVFIEVNSPEVNPGLNGLQIGQTIEDARQSLGTPESLNEYVMIYSSNQVIMKLDMDPNTGIIRSIKLFAE